MRYLTPFIQECLEERKMVFLAGPRQVGKTTLALSFLNPPKETHPAYLNWDAKESKSLIRTGQVPSKEPLIILDEIHKFARWRNMVKGIYDTRKSMQKIIVTGSARLDYYRKGGDSLQGRYHFFRLHPFSFPELNRLGSTTSLERLIHFGGFPEPLARGNERFSRRWQKERRERVLYDDLRELEAVREVSLIDLLVDELPNRVGAPLSIGNLKDVLSVSHESVERWVEVLERLYYCFRIAPFGSAKIRAVKKEKKLYLWDWALVSDPGARFENCVASHLLKFCHFQEDTQGYRMELRFLRDTDKREVDFVVLRDKLPLFAVECKTGEKAPSSAAHYFRQRTRIPRIYQVHLGKRDYGDEANSVRVLPFETFCTEVGLV